MNLKRILCVFGFHSPTPYRLIQRDGMYPYKTCTRCDDLRDGPSSVEILDIDQHLRVHRDTLTEKQRWDLLLAREQRDLKGKHQ